jgi:hypothetical protein
MSDPKQTATEVLCQTATELLKEAQSTPARADINLTYLLCLLESLYVIPMSEEDAKRIDVFLLELYLPKQIGGTEVPQAVLFAEKKLSKKVRSHLACGNG